MIFARFMAIYGHKFKSCFESQDEIRIAKREWALSLRGYSEHELVAAVNRCKETLAWMPTVAEFLAIVRDLNGDFGLPSTPAAYREAAFHADHPLEHQWSHLAVYHAGRNTGWFELRSEDERNILPRFSYQYDLMCRRVRQGEQLDEPVPQALENKQDTTNATFMLEFAREHNLDEAETCSMLFYLTCTPRSRQRSMMREKALEKLKAMGLENVELPE